MCLFLLRRNSWPNSSRTFHSRTTGWDTSKRSLLMARNTGKHEIVSQCQLFQTRLHVHHVDTVVDTFLLLYRYRIHRRNKGDVRRWYRCVSRFSVDCRATVCYEVAENVLSCLSTPHNHSPPLFSSFVRYIIGTGGFFGYHTHQ